MSTRKFTARIEEAGGGGAFVTIPFDVEEVFGKKRVPIRATIDGEPYRGTLMRMGGDCHMLGILKDIRAKIGKSVGDEVRITLEEDTEERTVDVPPDLQQALAADAKARALFDKSSYTHKKEFVKWIAEAKRAETREGRIAKTIEMLRAGETR